jgi:SWI/SNF-related matrix-associated actin-dependent regulator 1 of chromatin subfamily A
VTGLEATVGSVIDLFGALGGEKKDERERNMERYAIPVEAPRPKPLPVIQKPGFQPDGVWVEGDTIIVKAVYNVDSVAPARDIPGRFWNKETRVSEFPVSSKDAVKAWVKRFWPKLSLKALDSIGAVRVSEPKIEVREDGAFLYIKTPYAKAFVDGMHELPDCEFQRDGSKEWRVPRDRVAQLADIAARVYGARSKVLEAVVKESKEKLALATAVQASETIELPGGTLFPFQVAGVQFLERFRRALIADEMGLGKTIQSIAYLCRNPKSLPALVVCPASVKENWRREIERWGGGKLTVAIAVPKSLDGQLTVNPPNVLIINYDQLGKLVLEDEDIVTGKAKLSVRPSVAKWGPKVVVFDEAHYLKNSKAKRSKAADAIAELTGRRVIELTGTPVLNRPEELWHLLHLMDPEAWESESKFKFRYCDWEKAWHGHAVRVGAQRLEELHSRVTGHYMVRRLKKDVLKELPDKIRSCVPLSLEPADIASYRKLLDRTAAKILSETGGHFSASNMASVKAAVNTLRQEVGIIKAPLVAAWVQEALESTDKVVVFSYHHTVTDKIVEVLLGAGVTVARMDGRDSVESRQIAVDAFQNGKLQVLACGILAAGVGLNLTAADQVVFAERAWRPADHDQAEDRLHRIGQKRCVNVWFLDAEGTIDEDVRDLQGVKREAIAQAVDGGVLSQAEESMTVQVALRMLRRFQEKG